MRCRNYNNDLVWFGSKGIQSTTAEYQEIDATAGANVTGETTSLQHFKVEATKDEVKYVRFYDAYGMLQYSIPTTDLPLATLPDVQFIDEYYQTSWDTTLADVNAMTTGGDIKTKVESSVSVTEIIPISEGFEAGEFTLCLCDQDAPSNEVTIYYPDDTQETITFTNNETKIITKTFDKRYKQPIKIVADPSKYFFIGGRKAVNGSNHAINFYGVDLNDATSTANNSETSIYEIRLAPNMLLWISGALKFVDAGTKESSLRKVLIAEGLDNYVSSEVFANTKLESINMPNAWTDISNSNAFKDCKNLKSVITGNDITNVNGIFTGCDALETIILGDSITTLKLQNLPALKHVRLKDSITEIPTGAFYGCEALEEIEIPDSVTQIDNDIFGGCKNLKRIKSPYMPFLYACWFFEKSTEETEGYTLVEDPYNDTWLVPNTLYDMTITKGCIQPPTTYSTEIVYHAFKDFTMLRKITLGEDITRVQSEAFEGCTMLTFAYVENESAVVDADAFSNCDNLFITSNAPSGVDVVFYNGTEKVAYFNTDDTYRGILNQPITSIAVGNNDYDSIMVYLYPYTISEKAENFVGEQEGVASALNQMLRVIKGELWYKVSFGLPLYDKVSSKIQMDASVLQIVNSHKDVVQVDNFTSYVQGNSYHCSMRVVSKYGNIAISL